MSNRVCLSSINSRVIFGCIFLLGVTFVVACGPQATEQPLEKVTIQLSWAHQGQFAGFYAAEELGYYAEEGLDVTMLPLAAPGDDTIATVMDGNADFELSYGAGIIIGRSKASSITAIATIHRRHPLAFMTLTDSGITKPQDFPGLAYASLSPEAALSHSRL